MTKILPIGFTTGAALQILQLRAMKIVFATNSNAGVKNIQEYYWKYKFLKT